MPIALGYEERKYNHYYVDLIDKEIVVVYGLNDHLINRQECLA
jgi:hypothetical protein